MESVNFVNHMPLPQGYRLGPYEIVEPLGSGGMGEVYSAMDPRLSRLVAIKILAGEFAGTQEALERFEREAQAIAALSHPQIVSIYDFGCQGDIWYAVTELLEGETLRSRLSAGPLPWKQVVDIALQLCHGLSAAHSKGLIHRDLKPDNIFLTKTNQVKILDFGLVRRKPIAPSRDRFANLTQEGALVGTYPYMSPEQVLGNPIEETSDIFALGCVLYEMVSGKSLFLRDNPIDTMAAILHEDPPSLPKESVPLGFQQIISKCLEKDPANRFSSTLDIATALKSVQSETGTFVSTIDALRFPYPEATSIAVLPFVNMTADREQEYFCDGVTEELIHALSQLRAVHVISRTSSFLFKGKEVDVRSVGKQLSVDTVLQGSVRKSASRVRITVESSNTADGYQIWSEKYDHDMQDIFAVQEQIAASIVEKLKVRFSGKFHPPIVHRYTTDLDAYHLYLKGRYFWAKRYELGINKAMDYFKQAIEKDPNYALAYSGLADSYTILGNYGYLPPKKAFAQAKQFADRSLELDKELPEGHVARALIQFWFDWNWTRAENSFQHAIKLNPNDSLTRMWHATFFANLGRFDEALNEMLVAQQLDPLAPLINSLAGCVLYLARRYDDALLEFEKAFEIDPDFLVGLWFAASTYHQKAMLTESGILAERGLERSGHSAFSLASLACNRALEGRTEEAMRLVHELEEKSKKEYVPPFYFAIPYIGFGNRDMAFHHLEKALEDRNTQMCFLKTSPGMDLLRPDPRYERLLERIGFPP